jgi:DNA topoisomerase IB
VTRVVKEVAEKLGNTPAVCRSSYIDPRIIDLYEHGATIAQDLEALGQGASYGSPAFQGAIEQAVLKLLREPAERKQLAG